MTITGKEMNHGEKSPQVYVKPEGITSIVSLISTYRDAPGHQGRIPDKLGRPLLTSAFAKKREVPLTYSENSVPCHHPQQKGLCFIDPHHAAEGNQKSTLLDRKRVEYARQRTCSQAHLPIARRSNGCTKQAVLLTLLPRSSSLPDLLKSVTSLDSLCITVAGPCRSFTGLPY